MAVAEQHQDDNDDQHEPDQAVTAAAIIATAVAPITAAAAEQQQKHDNEKDETHNWKSLVDRTSALAEFLTVMAGSTAAGRFPQRVQLSDRFLGAMRSVAA